MHESVAATAPGTVLRFARLSGAVDTLSSAVAGFALLAGTRAFTFTALLAWREPVLGGVGLVLLASVGWLRWQCRRNAARRIVWKSLSTKRRWQRTVRRGLATIDCDALRGHTVQTRAASRQSDLKETPC